MKSKLVHYVIPILLVVVGVAFMVVGIFLHTNSVLAKRDWTETEAVIIDIKKERKDTFQGSQGSSDYDRYNYYITVQYEANNQTYTTLLDHYSSEMRVGDMEIIYYNPESPSQFASNAGASGGLAACAFGLAPLIVVFVLIKSEKKEKKNIKQLKESGLKVVATIKELEVDHSVCVNGKYARRLICCIDSVGDVEPKCYRSKRIYEDMPYVKGKSVDVYIDATNSENYFVDLESVCD